MQQDQPQAQLQAQGVAGAAGQAAAGAVQVVDEMLVFMERQNLNDLRVTVRSSAVAAGTLGGATAAGAGVGALVGGPVGAIFGGGIGFVAGAFTYWSTAPDFKPLPDVLRAMTPEQRQALVARFAESLATKGITLATFGTMSATLILPHIRRALTDIGFEVRQ